MILGINKMNLFGNISRLNRRKWLVLVWLYKWYNFCLAMQSCCINININILKFKLLLMCLFQIKCSWKHAVHRRVKICSRRGNDWIRSVLGLHRTLGLDLKTPDLRLLRSFYSSAGGTEAPRVFCFWFFSLDPRMILMSWDQSHSSDECIHHSGTFYSSALNSLEFSKLAARRFH